MPANTIPTKPKSYISLGGFAVVAVVFAVVSYLPYWRQCQTLNAQIVQQKDQLADMAAQAQEVQTSHDQVLLISDQVKDFDNRVPALQNLGTFLGQLSHELTAAGLQDAAVQAMTPIALGKCEQLPIQIHGSGTSAQCHNFLTRLEALPRKSSISHLTIEADAAMTGKVSLELTLSIYNLKAQSQQ